MIIYLIMNAVTGKNPTKWKTKKIKLYPVSQDGVEKPQSTTIITSYNLEITYTIRTIQTIQTWQKTNNQICDCKALLCFLKVLYELRTHWLFTRKRLRLRPWERYKLGVTIVNECRCMHNISHTRKPTTTPVIKFPWLY